MYYLCTLLDIRRLQYYYNFFRWDIEGTFDKGYDAHVDWVTDIVVKDKTIISCSNDHTVRIWLKDPEAHSIK